MITTDDYARCGASSTGWRGVSVASPVPLRPQHNVKPHENGILILYANQKKNLHRSPIHRDYPTGINIIFVVCAKRPISILLINRLVRYQVANSHPISNQ